MNRVFSSEWLKIARPGAILGWMSPVILFALMGTMFNFMDAATDAGQFRVDSTSTLSTRITSRISFNTTFADRLLSRPLPGRQRNEVILTTGLGFNF